MQVETHTFSVKESTLTACTVLSLRPIEFSGEFHAVLEHGRHADFSLIRFKQERGAASSFHKVVDTIRMVLKHRGLLVENSSLAKRVAEMLDDSV